MSILVNTNVSSLKIQNILTSVTSDMSEAMKRMSGGLKILNAKDDASGVVISSKLGVQLEGNAIAQKNVQNANALLATTEGNLTTILKNLTRVRDLTLQVKNSMYSLEELQTMQDEITQLIAEINRTNESATFSSLKLFDDEKLLKDGLTFQVGTNDGIDNTIKASSSLFESVEFEELTGIKLFDLEKSVQREGELLAPSPHQYTQNELFDKIGVLNNGRGVIKEEYRKEYEYWRLNIGNSNFEIKNENQCHKATAWPYFRQWMYTHGYGRPSDPPTLVGNYYVLEDEELLRMYKEEFLKDPYYYPVSVDGYNVTSLDMREFTKWKSAGNSAYFTLDETIQNLDSAINNITSRMSELGSLQNRLDSAFDILTNQDENLTSAKSIITDSDIALVASTYTQKSILQQVATSLLAQANQAPSIALSLV